MHEINDILVKVFKISAEEVVKAEYLKTDRWDSLGHISLMLALEKALGVEINGQQVTELTSYEKIVDFFKRSKHDDLSGSISQQKNQKTTDKPEIHRGLNNIHFDETNIGYIDQKNNALYYRGYSIDKLVNSEFSLEEVVYLVVYGKFPDKKELKELSSKLRKGRLKVFQNQELLLKHDFLPSKKYLQSTIPLISYFVEDNIEYISALPSIIYMYNNIKTGSLFSNEEMLSVNSHAEFVLKCLHPNKRYTDEEYKIFEKQMIIHMEHGANASTFSCRTTASTGAQFSDALLSAIATFSGKLHGGAMESVSIMIDELSKTPDAIENILEKKVFNAEPIYGFGHRVYKNNDPRAIVLKSLMDSLVTHRGPADFIEITNRIVKLLAKYSQKGLGINVDFYSALILKILNLELDMFLPSFMSSRIVGWLAHYNEQFNNNILIRPRLHYKGDILNE